MCGRASIVAILFLFFVNTSIGQFKYKVDSVSLWHDPTIGGNNTHDIYNEVWGFTMNGHEFGVIGARAGVYIVDVTDADRPEQVAYIPGTHKNAVNRDFHDFNGYLYLVADQGPSTFQIVDISELPDSWRIVYDSDSIMRRSHNIFIDSATSHLYACNVTKRDSSFVDLEIYDLSNPELPELVLTYQNPLWGFHDIYVKNDTAFGNNEFAGGVNVFDFTDLSNPVIISSLETYPDQGYNHSGWVNEDFTYYFFADETSGMDIKAVDISDITDIEVVSLFNSGTQPDKSLVHNLIVKGDSLYVSYYHDGLQIFDISKNVEQGPEKVAWYKTYTQPDYLGGKGAWGVYPFLPSGNILVSDREKGLFVFDIEDRFIPDLGDNDFVIYPNPVVNYFNVVVKPELGIRELNVYDLRGRLIYNTQNDESKSEFFDVFLDAASGLYTVELVGQSENYVSKLVVIK